MKGGGSNAFCRAVRGFFVRIPAPKRSQIQEQDHVSSGYSKACQDDSPRCDV